MLRDADPGSFKAIYIIYDSYTGTAREKARQRDMQKPVDDFFEWVKSAIRRYSQPNL